MEFYCRVTATGLVPLDEFDAEQKSKLRLDSDVKVKVSYPRNLEFHRKLMALCRITADNLPHAIAEERHIYNTETMLAAIKIDLGMFDVVDVAGRSIVRLHSISFAKMDESEFERFYDRAVTDILENYLIGADREELKEEVKQFISQRT